jgi:oligopeptidase B
VSCLVLSYLVLPYLVVSYLVVSCRVWSGLVLLSHVGSRGSDDSCVFYTKLDDEHRPHQVWLHLLGTPQETDILLFQDDDGLFNVSVGKSLSGECVVISSESIETSEAHVIFLPPPSSSSDLKESQAAHLRAATMKVLVQPREDGLRYDVDHQGDHLLVVTNEGDAKNGKLMRVPLPPRSQRQGQGGSGGGGGGGVEAGCLQKEHWEEVRPYNPRVEISGVLPFRRCVAVFGRAEGGQKVWIYTPEEEGGGGDYSWEEVTFDEECYSIHSSQNHVYDSDVIRVKFSSMLTPQQVSQLAMNGWMNE